MGIIVDRGRCHGCPGLAEARCEKACPGDLMVRVEGKAKIRAQSDCWDCLSCVKACPAGALRTQLPFQLADRGASLVPTVRPDRIIWTLTDRHGRVETFELPREVV